jgi:hypothetical protein
MGLMDFFGQEAGQARRRALEEALSYYIPPELAGPLGLLQMVNPVAGVERAAGASQEMLAPGASGWDRARAGGDMALEIAGVVAPAAALRYAGRPAAEALQEGLLGFTNAADAFAADEFGGLRISSAAADPAIQRADEVLGLIKSGRADEVTDAMLDMGDSVQNARLNEYLYRNYDLPMDYASRMGRAIQEGFDVNDEMYRGDAPRQSFETGSGQREQIGVTGSNIPDVAASYIPARGEGGIYPLFSRGQNDAVIEAGGQNWNVILPDTPVQFQGERSRLDEYIPVDQYFEPYDVKAGTAFFDTNDLSRIFQGYGADRVKFSDLVDRGASAKYYGPQSSSPSDVTMVANPANVRSRFARFDPRLSHLRNLNAALAAGVPLGLLSMSEEEQH